MKVDFGMGVKLEIKETKTMGKLAFIDNTIDIWKKTQLVKL